MTDEPSSKARSGRSRQPLLARLRGQLPVRRARFWRLRDEMAGGLAKLSAQLVELNSRVDGVAAQLLALPDAAGDVPLTPIIPLSIAEATEVCLFVSFAPEPWIRPHVCEHVRALAQHGVAVVLVVNSPHPPHEFRLDPELAALLRGCLIRANRGFDFAAWAHAYSLAQVTERCRRLFLVNDSIVGPLNELAFAQMMAQIRGSTADLLGLTENFLPRPHLQSYFLVVNSSLLHAEIFRRLMRGVVNLPTKQDVITQYEIQLTPYLRAKGLRCESVFSAVPHQEPFTDDTIFNWARLIESGFPFIKARVLDESGYSADAVRLIPQQFRRKS